MSQVTKNRNWYGFMSQVTKNRNWYGIHESSY